LNTRLFLYASVGNAVIIVLIVSRCVGQAAIGATLNDKNQNSFEIVASQVAKANPFMDGLTWCGSGSPGIEDCRNILAVFEAWRIKRMTGGISVFEDYVTSWPTAGWTPSLRFSMARYYQRHGQFSKALSNYSLAWKALASEVTGPTKTLADEVFSDRAYLLSRLGQWGELERLLAETNNRIMDAGRRQQTVNAARDRMTLSKNNSTAVTRCGGIALAAMPFRNSLN
jgi:hypothetical protein